jgi:hypothetical protein
VQLPQHRPLLVLVRLHPLQDVVQRLDCLEDVRTLVQHHALGARGQPSLCQRFKHLRGPDHRHVRGFRQPQDLLLHLGEPLPAHLHRQVTAGDHHAELPAAHAGQEQIGQALEGSAVLDLQHDPQVAGVEPGQMLLEQLDVPHPPHEGQADHVGVPGDEVQVLLIFLGQHGLLERAVRQVDALVGSQLLAVFAPERDLHIDFVALDVPDHAADAAVIEPDAFARMDLRERLGQACREPARSPTTPPCPR